MLEVYRGGPAAVEGILSVILTAAPQPFELSFLLHESTVQKEKEKNHLQCTLENKSNIEY